jgi:hypothetical protein
MKPHVWAQYLQALKRLKRKCVNDGAIKNESRRPSVRACLLSGHIIATSILLSSPGTRIVMTLAPESDGGNYKNAITD